jgi:hypothetical protein
MVPLQSQPTKCGCRPRRFADFLTACREIIPSTRQEFINITLCYVEADCVGTLAYAGTFYLPNRLHARPEQVRAAYPELEVFIARKRNYDPQLRFRNLMWDKYFFD